MAYLCKNYATCLGVSVPGEDYCLGCRAKLASAAKIEPEVKKEKPVAASQPKETQSAKRKPKQFYQYKVPSPHEIAVFLQNHAEGCYLSELATLLGLGRSAAHLALHGKINATKVPSPYRFSPNGGVWWVEFKEALRCSESVCCWIAYSEAVEELKKLGCVTNDDCLREYHNGGYLKLAKGEDIFGRPAFMRKDLSEIAKMLPVLMKQRRHCAAKREGAAKDDELTAEQVHELMPELRYKIILTLFVRGMIKAQRRGGRWYTHRSAIDQFLDEVASGLHHNKARDGGGLMPTTVRTCIAIRNRLAKSQLN
jgi:hypothetical protein